MRGYIYPFYLPKSMKLQLSIKGMHCKSCEILIQESLEELGVKAKADHKKGLVNIEFDESKTTKEQIIQAIAKEGYTI